MSNSKSVTDKQGCYRTGCDVSPKWRVASLVEQKNPDGTDLTLLTCDSHYSKLTTDLKRAGTRYTLSPICNHHTVPPIIVDEIVDSTAPSGQKSSVRKTLLYVAVLVVGAIISPFILLYYAGKWILGWRPS